MTGEVRQRVGRSFFVALFLSTVAVACAVRMVTVTGPDGAPWQTCDGNDAKCIEAIGAKCPKGYVVGHEKMFNCKPEQADDPDPCVTDQELETTPVFVIDDTDTVFELRPGHLVFGSVGALVKAQPLRGPDCHVWLLRPSFDWSTSSRSSTARFSKLLGRACPNGSIETEVFGEAMYQCKAPPDAGQPDAGQLGAGQLDAIAPANVEDSQ
jgi:hypothetical protein